MKATRPKSRSLMADALGMMASKVVFISVGFVTGVIITRWLGPEGRGIYAALLVYPNLLVTLAELGIRQATAFYIGQKRWEDQAIISASLFIILLSGLAFMLVSAGIFFWIQSGQFTWFMVVIAVSLIPIKLLITYSRAVLLGKESFGLYNRLFMATPAFVLLATLLLVCWLNLGITGALSAMWTGYFMAAIYGLYVVSRYAKLRPRPIPDISKGLMKLGAIYALSLFVAELNYSIDIVLMERLSTLEELGKYSLAVSVTEKLWGLPGVLGMVIFSRSANATDLHALTRMVARTVRLNTIVIFLAGAGLFLLADFLIPFIYGREFAASATMIRFLLPGIIMLAVLKILRLDLSGRGLPMVGLLVGIPPVIMNVLLNIWLIPRFGGNGAAVASSISYSAATLLFVVIYARTVGIPVREIFAYERNDFISVYQSLKKKLTKRTSPALNITP